MDLFRLRAAQLGKNAILAVDSTSRSAYGHSLADIHWGKNKDHLPLKQTVEVVAYTLTEHMPVYYCSFPGNTPDSRGLQTILTDLQHAGFKDIILMTDRGYETIRNLETYILRQQPMIMCTKVEQQLVSGIIGAFEDFDDMARPEEMEVDPESLIYYHQYDVDYEVKSKGKSTQKSDRLKVNLYLDPVRRSEELVNLDADLKSQRTALEQMVAEKAICDDDATLKRIYSYFDISYAPDTRRILSFTENTKKTQRAKKYSGFFSLVTHKLDLTAMETFEHYVLRDEQEKYFHQMKGQMGFDKQQNWSEEGKQGRLLILFVALILSSYMKHIWKSTKLKKFFDSSLAVIDEMRPIRMIMTLSIRHISDQGLVLPQLFDDQLHNVDVAHLIVTANIIDFTDATTMHYQIDGLAVILHIQPVTDIKALAIDGKRLVIETVRNHQRNQLLRKMIRPVIVAAA